MEMEVKSRMNVWDWVAVINAFCAILAAVSLEYTAAMGFVSAILAALAAGMLDRQVAEKEARLAEARELLFQARQMEAARRFGVHMADIVNGGKHD